MFSSIARRYDLANDLLSLGIHRSWRNRVIKMAEPLSGKQILDLCTGTGELAVGLAHAVGACGSVVGIDFVPDMLAIAHHKISDHRQTLGRQGTANQGIRPALLCADALHIPLRSNSIDLVTIAFGIRNVDSVSGCLVEIHRVLKPGGRLLVLEFGAPTIPIWSSIYSVYSKKLMPIIGGLVTGNRDAYEYLPKTSAAFPAREEFLRLMSEEGFTSCRYTPLSGGIAYIYSGSTPALH